MDLQPAPILPAPILPAPHVARLPHAHFPHPMHTDTQLQQLIERGEQFEVEFRGEEQAPLEDRELVEAVVCLANGGGGTLLVGVEDDGRVTGARPRHGSYTDVRRLEALIAGGTVPSCPAGCELATVQGSAVLVVRVPAGRPVTCTSSGVYRRRATAGDGRPVCLPYLHHEMQSREASRGALDYSALLVPEARWEDLDPLEFERLRQTIEANRGRADASLLGLSEAEMARALGLGEGGDGARVERVRVAGLLLLGRQGALERFVPTHEAAFQLLSGTRLAVNDFFRWPLIKLSEELARRFAARNEEREVEAGFVRVGIPDYSPAGFREAVHNALVHRDYTRTGAVHVQWRDGGIEVSNPGGFPADVRLDTLLVTPPRPRNPVLADAVRRIGLVERSGRGIDTIFEGQLRFGRAAPDYSLSTPESVQVRLPGGAADLALARLILARDTPSRRVTVEEMLVLNALEHERRISAPRAAALVQRPEPAAAALLERLVEEGLLEARQERRERVFHFSAATYRQLGTPEAHVRLRGVEPIQREQMVLQYVTTHGRITRSQTADLCQVGGREARAVLEKLVKRGDLVVRGERRGSYYERVGAS